MTRLRAAFIYLVFAIAPVCAGAAQTTLNRSGPSQEQWRREYNTVAAAIDTLMRLYGSVSLERLTRSSQTQQSGSQDPLVLLFWADDEAEVFLNGYPVGRTRLTPIQIDVPRFYLEDHNVLRVHCWDTDSVESGFMAGLYLQEPGGGLRPAILTTDDFNWQTDSAKAQEIFYTHSIPDIPGAKVIWGDHLFGELWLQVEFSREAVMKAASKLESMPPGVQRNPMEFHQIVSRLVALEARRDHIVSQMAGWRRGSAFPRYSRSGSVGSIAAFTLGRAAPLKEGSSTQASERLQAWTKSLPTRARELVLQPQRHLKGWKDATPAVPLGDGPSESVQREDRRTDYQPPPEIRTGTHTAHVQQGIDPSARLSLPVSPAWVWLSTLSLAAYVTSASWQWWRLFTSAEWT